MRLLMTRPPAGVSPMLVSTQRPSITAARLAPLPRCASTTRPRAASPATCSQLGQQERVGEAVKAVAPQPGYAGDGQRAADRRQIAMEGGIEAGDVRSVRRRGHERVDQRDLVGQVVGSERDERAQAMP